MAYFEVEIVMTAKGHGPKEEYRIFDKEVKHFKTMAEVKTFLKERYGKARRSPMYVDKKAGGAEQVGYVIGFKNADYSHSPVEKWLQKDWVTITELEPKSPFKGRTRTRR